MIKTIAFERNVQGKDDRMLVKLSHLLKDVVMKEATNATGAWMNVTCFHTKSSSIDVCHVPMRTVGLT